MASEAAATSKRYLYIDSGDFSTSHTNGVSNQFDTGSVYDVHLSDPIHHVHSVSLLSFTMPHELYNVDKFNNLLTMVLWSSNVSSKVWSIDVRVAEGMYTLDKLITALNDAIVVSMEYVATSPDFGLGANGDYTRPTFQFVASSTATDAEVAQMAVTTGTYNGTGLLTYSGNTVNRVAFVATDHTDRHGFKHTIWHRLGFVETQIPAVSSEDLTPVVMNTLYVNSGSWLLPMLVENLQIPGPTQTPAVPAPYAAHLGTESFDNVMISCDLVSGQTYRTIHNAGSSFGGNAVAQTTRTDVIGIIPMSATLGGFLSWTRPTDNFMRIGLSGRKPVDSLRISITSDRGTPFPRATFPGFSAILEFTVIEQVDKINAQVHQANQRAAFLSRHMPMQLE